MRSRSHIPALTTHRTLQRLVVVGILVRICAQSKGLLAAFMTLALTLTACATGNPTKLPAPAPKTSESIISADLSSLAPSTPDQRALDQPVQFERISLEKGLSQSSVFSILQDRQGLLWFGTQDGLNRYDGYEFTVYRPVPGDANSLSSGYILSLHQDREGTLWIGTNGSGLNSLAPETGVITRHTGAGGTVADLEGFVVHTIYQDREGVLWVGTERGLNRLEPGARRFTHYQHEEDEPTSLAPGEVRAIFEDSDGTLWIGTTGGGLSRLDPGQERFAHHRHDPDDPASLGGNAVTAIYQDEDGTLWIGTEDGGLSRFDPPTGHFQNYRHEPEDPHSLSSNAVWAIEADRAGALWVGTGGGGLVRFDPHDEQFTGFRHDLGDPNSISDNWIWSLYADQSGLLWIGTLGGGANVAGCAGKSFAHYKAERQGSEGLSGNVVWSLFEDRDGVLWIGTFGSGLDSFDRQTGRWRHYENDPQNPASLSSNVVRAITQDPEGTIWIGTEGGGLSRLDLTTRTFTHYRHRATDPSSLTSDDVYTVYVDRAGAVWAGTSVGPGWLDRATGRFAPVSLDGSPVRAIYEDRRGVLWLGTELELYSLNPATGDLTAHALDSSILCVREDREGNLWIGTFGDGLIKLDRQREVQVQYRQKNGLPSDVVYGILEDDQGDLWLSTNSGLSEFQPGPESFVNYDVSDGIQSSEFNAGAYYRSTSGEMFFGGVNGFNAFFPDGLTTNLHSPPVVLTALMQGGVDIATDQAVGSVDQIAFRWPNNFFEFRFAALNYCQPERNQYAYMLEGLDRDWLYVGTQRTGRYTNLSGKTYTLRVKGSNNDGIWNEEGVSLKVTVIPPFWATWWFRGSLVVVLVAAAIASFRLRVRSVEARSRELKRQVEDRTRALAERTRETERRKQELEALYRADAELHRHLDLDQVLTTLVDIAVDILKAGKSSLVVWDERREKLVVRVAKGYHTKTLEKMVFFPGEGTVGHVATTGQPVAVKDARTDPRVDKRSTITEPEGIQSYMQVPIEVGGEIFGVFSADYAEPRAFGAEEKRLFLALAQRAALAIDTAQLHEHAQQLAVVEERSRLARELHDAVTQTLFSSSLIAETVPELWETDPAEGRQLLQELRQLSRGALAEMRTLLLELRPAALVDTNLADLLRQLGDASTGRIGAPVTVSVNGQCTLPSDVHVALYRIAQESLNNVVKHSEATEVSVSLRCRTNLDARSSLYSGQVELRVIDNGRGFDLAQVPANRLGLGIIRERAQDIDAFLEIKSEPGKGTSILARWIGDREE